MNAAFLLVTTAWLGADAAPAAKPAPAPAPAPAAAGCCDDCGGGHSWGGRLRGRFSHGCGCEDKCDSCTTGLLEKFKGRFHRDCGCDTGCAPTHTAHHAECNTCDTCGHGHGGRLKGLFHRGCNDGCNDCGAGPAGVPPRAEPIPAPKPGTAPKKMPDAPKSAQILTPQTGAPTSTLVIEQ